MEQKVKKILLTVVVLLFAGASISFMDSTYANYTEFLRAIQGMDGRLVNLHVEGNTITFTFQFTNKSAWDLHLINVQFNLYAEEEFLGNFDMRERIYLKTGETDVIMRVDVHPNYIENLTSSANVSLETFLSNRPGMRWFLYGGAVIELPIENEERTITIREQWVSQ
ncbi:MAG: hypothetical protein HXS44_04075 [Theionarchaea archaeon]|nr:hypothetical protein [Theionarchaea archaeon]